MKDTQKFKRHVRVCMGIFITLFAVLIVYLGYSVLMYGEKWFATPYNPRLHSAAESIIAGSIYDRNGNRMVWTEDGSRQYAGDVDTRRALSHVLGDAYGKSVGAETIFAKYLYGMDKDILERIKDIGTGQDKNGNDISLTIDSELCEYIYDQMDGKKGSVVLLNYKTGEILASVSLPAFDPQTVGKDTPEDTSLVDRATMGRYPPGSIMKIMTAAAAVEEGIDIKYTCTGEDIIEGQKVTCAGGTAHGELTLESAFTKSCNTYFANLAVKIGGQRLLQEASKFGFNKEWNFSDINLYRSNFEVSEEEGDVAWAGIGQYNDLITPMHAAMIAGAIANDGVMMEPKLLKSVDFNGYTQFNYTPAKVGQVTDAATARTIKEYMMEVVKSGTGTSAAIKGTTMYGKTGTAEFVEDGEVKNHSWFAGFIEDSAHPYAIAVIFEGAGYGSRYAAPMAGKVMARAIS